MSTVKEPPVMFETKDREWLIAFLVRELDTIGEIAAIRRARRMLAAMGAGDLPAVKTSCEYERKYYKHLKFDEHGRVVVSA